MDRGASAWSLELVAQKKAWQRTLYDAGYVGMGWPQGVRRPGRAPDGAGDRRRGDGARRRARRRSTAWAWALIGPTLIAHGTEEQKQRYVKRILTAEDIWCQLYSEPDSGSDLASLKTSAVRKLRDGDHWVVNGQKVWTSLGPIADYGVLLARTDPSVPKHQGISYFILDMHQPGRRGAAAQADHRQLRVRRGVLHQRRRAGREHHRPAKARAGSWRRRRSASSAAAACSRA